MGECPICYEKITSKTSITTRCKHVFHNACLQRWMETSQTCPMCRGDIHPTKGRHRPFTTREAIAQAFANGMPNMARVIAEHHPPPPPVPQRNTRANIIALGTFINQNQPTERLPIVIVNGDVW